ncbi:glycosyltransferase family 2 protein [Pseudomonas rubra]|uniref:Glycosyltransferase n=1 Tax=Pseudomonas rubra TaxID=2942627 RepID=A0ABT5P4D1_9PSED|nr:glycosyltransferase [Pseudomonas rubra]MDD1013145.1 glycosyltransferase [Pseudomonas rubra]MDD1036945.1 glycosyltransferase [Pseudomonas rubra]MDD1154461.1 glycosyltransferase [Pseudomonas rubra]
MGEQAIGCAALLDDVTVVLLGQDEPGYAGRAAHYYQARFAHLRTLAAPSSQGAVGIWSEQLLQALEQVDTGYAVLTLECDFLLTTGIAGAVEALRADADYVMAQGYSLGYQPGNGEVAYYKIGSAPKAQLHASSALGRIGVHAEFGLQAWRAVVRIEVLKAAVRSVPAHLSFDSWCIAVSYALLAQGASRLLAHTSVMVEYRPWTLSEQACEELLSQTVRQLQQWDSEQAAVFASARGFEVLNAFVRNTHERCEAPLLFTSRWNSLSSEPQLTFEPTQFVDMPYYNAGVFGQLRSSEFILHAWPAGQIHSRALEGTWVQQQALLTEHSNDTAESLMARYWQAFALGVFNPQVCQHLLAGLGEQDQGLRRDLGIWLEQLDLLPATSVEAQLASTPSGKVLEAIAAASPNSAARERIFAHLGKNPAPQMAFVVIDLEDNNTGLQNTFDSLVASGLRNFKIVVLKAGELPAITTARDALHFIKVTPANMVAHLNQVVRQLSSEWLLMLQAGDVLATGGLLRLQVELSGAQACQAICANEVQRDSDGRLLSVVRPGCSLDLLRSRPDLMAQHWLVRRQAIIDLGGYSDGCAQALEFDLLLRLVEANGIGGMAHMDEYLVVGQQSPASMAADALTTLKRHLSALGYRGQVNESADGTFQVDYRHPQTPQVSIVLVADSDLEQLKQSLASVVQRTRYGRYEVIVTCESANAEAVAAGLATVQGLGSRVRLFACESSVRAQMVNQAAALAQGQYLVLMSSRSEVVSPAWIESLLNQAQRPEVGIVGCQMFDRDGVISHAGYELLGSGLVSNARQGASRLQVTLPGLEAVRSCQAVSADCLMVGKALFEQCAGLDEQLAGGVDVDMCLKAAQAGLLAICVPQAQVLNSAVPLPAPEQCLALVQRWPSAFSTRVVVDIQHGVDVSRTADVAGNVVLEWLP